MRRLLLATALLLSVTACALLFPSPRYMFMHKLHRQNYVLTPSELKSVQLYISTDVLAQDVSGTSAIVVDRGTPGVAIAVGGNWLRVAFSYGGAGVVFVAKPDRTGESAYWLASETDDGDYVPVKDLEPQQIRAGAQTFNVVQGDDARLLISGNDLDALIQKRRTIPGRTQ